jgi:hypothetical protein
VARDSRRHNALVIMNEVLLEPEGKPFTGIKFITQIGD